MDETNKMNKKAREHKVPTIQLVLESLALTHKREEEVDVKMSIVQLVYVFLVANRKSYTDDGIGGGGDAATTVRMFEADQNIERAHSLMLISCFYVYTYTFTHIYMQKYHHTDNTDTHKG